MKGSYICHVKIAEFLYETTRTGVYYICLAPAEWALTSITDQFPLSREVTTYFLWRAPHTYFSCERPTELTERHITVVDVLQCDCVKAQPIIEFLKGFVLPQKSQLKKIQHHIYLSIDVLRTITSGFVKINRSLVLSPNKCHLHCKILLLKDMGIL